MLARAPGKIVVSGAYAVLEGAPAIVSAVDRYVVADTEQVSALTTPEFAAATPLPQPYFDASSLRDGEQKLGLGSSAAICVACLGALELDQQPQRPLADIRRLVFEQALQAHRVAQGGGSGIDVAASCYGGTLLARRSEHGELVLGPLELPNSWVIEVWATGQSASTSEFVAKVQRLKQTNPAEHRALLGAQYLASEKAVDALQRGSGAAFVEALSEQHEALLGLGRAAGIEIVVDAARQLHLAARASGGCLLPAGAGGGDISIYVGQEPASDTFRGLARRLGQKPLHLGLGALGLEPLGTPEGNGPR